MKHLLTIALFCWLGILPVWADDIVIPVTGQAWQLSFTGPRLMAEDSSVKGGQFRYKANAGKFNFTVFVEPPARTQGGHKECQEFYWAQASRNPMINAASVKHKSAENFERVQYVIATELEGTKFTQANANYYFAYEGRWIDVHVSVIDPTAADVAEFKKLDASLAYSALPKAATTRKVQLDGLGELTLQTPAGWQLGNTLRTEKPDMYGWSIVSHTTPNAQVKINLFSRPKPATDEVLKLEVKKALASIIPGSVEQKANLKPFELTSGVGYYAILTDASLVDKPIEIGNTKVIGSGLIQLSPNTLGVVSIFIDDPESDDFQTLIKVVNNLKFTPDR